MPRRAGAPDRYQIQATVEAHINMGKLTDPFDASKSQILDALQGGIDRSPKGSVDEPILSLIEEINKLPNFVTTSSCSGRVSVFFEPAENKKKVCESFLWARLRLCQWHLFT